VLILAALANGRAAIAAPAPTPTPAGAAGTTASGVPYGNAPAVAAAFVTGPGPFSVALPPEGQAPVASWPAACLMLDQAEIGALLPGFTISGWSAGPWDQRQANDYFSIGEAPFSGFSGGQPPPQPTDCQYDLTGPAVQPSAGANIPDHAGAVLEVVLEAIGDAAHNQQRWNEGRKEQAAVGTALPDTYALFSGLGGGGNCYYSGAGELQCVAGDWAYDVLGSFGTVSGDRSITVENDFLVHVEVPAASNLATRMRP
jgi:hypothetical protein